MPTDTHPDELEAAHLLLAECAAEIEAYVKHQYTADGRIFDRRRYDRDMEIVVRAREFLKHRQSDRPIQPIEGMNPMHTSSFNDPGRAAERATIDSDTYELEWIQSVLQTAVTTMEEATKHSRSDTAAGWMDRLSDMIGEIDGELETLGRS